GGMRRVFEVRGSDSYLSSNDLRVHAGLGGLDQAEVEVRWPSGQIDRTSNVAANHFYLAREGHTLQPDPLSSTGATTKKKYRTTPPGSVKKFPSWVRRG